MKNDNHVWDNKLPTAQMLGRWQPWHQGWWQAMLWTARKGLARGTHLPEPRTGMLRLRAQREVRHVHVGFSPNIGSRLKKEIQALLSE